MEQQGLSFSVKKSSVCIFIKFRYHSDLISDYPVTNSQPTHLGLLLDKKLKWCSHIKHVVNRSENFLNVLKVLSVYRFLNNTVSIQSPYSTAVSVRPILDYGSARFGDAAASLLKKKHLQTSVCVCLLSEQYANRRHRSKNY